MRLHLAVVAALLAMAGAQVGHQREMRGVWVATVDHIDWPPVNATTEVAKAALIDLFDTYVEMGLNTIIFHVRPEGDALYQSNLEPWSRYLTGKQGEPPSPMWDPLAFAVEEAHKRNMQLHAWINPYRARMNKNSYLSPMHLAKRFPQYAYDYGPWTWLDPGAAPVQDATVDVVVDIVSRYDVDGVHMDDYFYPYKYQDHPFPDSATYSAYQKAGGKLSLGDWRRENVNVLVQRLYKAVHSTKPNVQFGISPFGIWRPGYPPTIAGLDAYAELFADSRKWLASGWVDYLAPQLYWAISAPNQSFPLLFDWWRGVAQEYTEQPRFVYTGNALYRHTASGWPLDEIAQQVNIVRKAAKFERGTGCIHFSGKDFKRPQVYDFFPKNVYTAPAMPPSMPWLDRRVPAPPTGLSCSAASRTVTWRGPASEPALRSFSVYSTPTASTSPLWTLAGVVNKATTAYVLPGAGSVAQVAVCSVSATVVEGCETVRCL